MTRQEGIYKTMQYLDLNIYYIFYLSIISAILVIVQLNLMTKTQNPILSMLASYIILLIILKIISIMYNRSKFINQGIL